MTLSAYTVVSSTRPRDNIGSQKTDTGLATFPPPVDTQWPNMANRPSRRPLFALFPYSHPLLLCQSTQR